MGLSIITPHYNEFNGLQRIYDCLKKQISSDWEWIIVDDFSDKTVLLNVQIWMANIVKGRVHFIENTNKSNASVCRNKGLENTLFENVVFLDADDYLAEDFVSNRQIEFNEFAIFPNYDIVSNKGINTKRLIKQREELLNSFLAAQFLWQTTCVLWDKKFLVTIGKFDPKLQRLQDVELFIRALYESKKYKIIDNKVDFFYSANPIRLKDDIVKKSCASVNYLIAKLQVKYNLDEERQSLLKAYYFACVRGLHRCKNRKQTIYVKGSLKLFYKKKYINIFRYSVGMILLFLYQYHMISDALFLRINRYFFK
jgi:glycosyltransferase involved in cell wall biosynthesis